MENYIGIMLLMLLIGPIQLIGALIHVYTTKNPQTRHRLQVYLLGVVIYFTALFALVSFESFEWMPTLSYLHFFGGAWGLAFYHLVIVILSGRKARPELYRIDGQGNRMYTVMDVAG